MKEKGGQKLREREDLKRKENRKERACFLKNDEIDPEGESV